jgi:hypothetical protein
VRALETIMVTLKAKPNQIQIADDACSGAHGLALALSSWRTETELRVYKELMPTRQVLSAGLWNLHRHRFSNLPLAPASPSWTRTPNDCQRGPLAFMSSNYLKTRSLRVRIFRGCSILKIGAVMSGTSNITRDPPLNRR